MLNMNSIEYTSFLFSSINKEKHMINVSICWPSSNDFYQDYINILHPDEIYYLNSLEHKKRIHEYLLGRFAAKVSISEIIDNTDLKCINIVNGILNQPVIFCEYTQNIQVSISHCKNYGAAIAYSDIYQCGIDIEYIDVDNRSIIETCTTEREKVICSGLSVNYGEALTMLWTAKESISKIMRTGLTTPFEIFEIEHIDMKENYFILNYKLFPQYYCIAFEFNRYFCSITYPKNVKLQTNILDFRSTLINRKLLPKRL